MAKCVHKFETECSIGDTVFIPLLGGHIIEAAVEGFQFDVDEFSVVAWVVSREKGGLHPRQSLSTDVFTSRYDAELRANQLKDDIECPF